MGRSRGIWNDPEWNRGDDLLGTPGPNIEIDFAGNPGMMLLVQIRLSVYRIPLRSDRRRRCDFSKIVTFSILRSMILTEIRCRDLFHTKSYLEVEGSCNFSGGMPNIDRCRHTSAFWTSRCRFRASRHDYWPVAEPDCSGGPATIKSWLRAELVRLDMILRSRQRAYWF